LNIFHQEEQIMTHQLLLNIPENIYQKLIIKAQKQEQTLENIALKYLAQITVEMEEDPLDNFISAFNSDNSDWLENHDHYLRINLIY
jgi:hypothetical protein